MAIPAAICAVSAQQKTTKSSVVKPLGLTAPEWRKMVTVLIRMPSGQQLGSGVVVAEVAGGLWIASNRHVVVDQSTVCVVQSDPRTAAALVMPLKSKQNNQELDLALIWQPHLEQGTAKVAGLSKKATAAKGLPVVMATGFPTPIGSTSLDGPIYSERPGLLVPLLSEPIQDGLDLAYTALIDKGMSGGGVFLGSELIGINSAHRDPLWPGQWRNKKGQSVSESLNEKLDLVSLGLSIKHINQAIKAAAMPKENDLKRLVGVECNQSVPPAQPGKPKENLLSK